MAMLVQPEATAFHEFKRAQAFARLLDPTGIKGFSSNNCLMHLHDLLP